MRKFVTILRLTLTYFLAKIHILWHFYALHEVLNNYCRITDNNNNVIKYVVAGNRIYLIGKLMYEYISQA